MDRTLFIILAGGEGTRLRPLTEQCPKPLVRFGPSARIMDFTLYNCLVSRSPEVVVLTQYLGGMIERYLEQQWVPAFAGQGLKLSFLSGSRSPQGRFLGTADAVYQALLARTDAPDRVVVLAADHIYRMDYRSLLVWHQTHGAGATVAVQECNHFQAHRFGIVETRPDGRLTNFWEKPRSLHQLPDLGQTPLASMGFYVFSRPTLLRYLQQNQDQPELDFGHHVLPRMVKDQEAWAFRFRNPDGSPRYWRDVGDLHSYWQAQMELLDGSAEELYEAPVLPGIRPPLSPAHRVSQCLGVKQWLYNSLISESAEIGNALIEDSVIGPEAMIEDGARIKRSMVLDGAVVRKGVELDSALIAPGFQIQAAKVPAPPLSSPLPGKPSFPQRPASSPPAFAAPDWS